jgi:type I restriction enzyme S subunit
MVALRPNPTTVYPKYLFAILRSRETQLQIVNLHVGSLIPHFKKGDFDKLRLPIPDPSLQRYIGDLYYDITELIHRNRRMNETLEQVVRALMKSWFVDFDPVQDSEAHRTPFGVDEATCTLFPSGFEDTRRGKMPRGWTIASVSKVANVNSLSLSAKDKLDTIEYVEISEVSRGEIGNMPLYDRGTEPSRARRRLRHGDTALSTVRPDRGAYFLCLDPPINRLASTGFAVVSPIDVPWTFLYLALTTDEVSEYLGRVADGGAYPAVNPSVISDIEFVLPNKPVLDAFHTIAKPFLQLVEANRLENRTLRQLRDTLLPKLISGEVRIRDAENLVNSTINPKEAA